jgi:sugar phosphate isomerase/epimerase
MHAKPTKPMPLGVTAVMLPELDFAEQIALCASLGVTHYSVRPRNIPPEQVGKPWGNWGNHKFDLTPARLIREGREMKKQLEDAGLTAFGTVPAVSVLEADDALKVHFEGAAIIGAGRVRIAPESYPKTRFDYAALLDKQVENFKRVVAIAKGFGQKVVLETHCYSFVASPALAWNLCRHFDPADLGVIFDLANFNIEGNYQPVLGVSVLGPYIDHCHVGGARRVTQATDTQGFRQVGYSMCAVTEADLNIPAWIRTLHEGNLNVPLVIENFSENMPGAIRLADSAVALRRVLDTLVAG